MNDSNKNNIHIKDEITYIEFLLFCYKKRLLITILFIIILIVSLCIGAYYYHGSPRLTVSTLSFNLNFDGLNRHKYPNGSKFEESEIISTPILLKTYNSKNLQEIFKSFGNFKNSISVLRENPNLGMIDMEYKAKLSNKDLTTAERTEIENEYMAKRAEAFQKTQYALVCSYYTNKYMLPNAYVNEILKDILDNWIDFAKNEKGVFGYNLGYNDGTLDYYFLENEDYFIRLDRLWNTLDDFIRENKEYKSIPNISNLNIEYQGKEYNLERITASLINLQRDVGSQLNYLAKNGITKNRSFLINYIEVSEGDCKNDILEIENAIQLKEGIRSEDNNQELYEMGLKKIKLEKDLEYYQRVLKFYQEGKQDEVEPRDVKKATSDIDKLYENVKRFLKIDSEFKKALNDRRVSSFSEFYRVESFTYYSQRIIRLKFVLIRIGVVVGLFLVILIIVLYFKFIVYLRSRNNLS